VAPPGATLHNAHEIPKSDKPVEVKGDVMWIVDGKHDEPERDHGMGVRFLGLGVEQLLALNDYFSSLTATVDHDDA
jgi:hypothetical protein